MNHFPEDHADQRLEREREELTLTFASWNLIHDFLRKIDGVRRAPWPRTRRRPWLALRQFSSFDQSLV
jgi:hypothetical protein